MYLPDFTQKRNRTLIEVLRQQAEHNGETTFVTTDSTTLTFSECWRLVQHYAAGLAGHGAAEGDNVCFFMEACTEYVIGTLACSLLGARWIPVNTDYRGIWLSETISDSAPRVLVTDPQHATYLKDIKTGNTRVIIKGEATDSLGRSDLAGFSPVTAQLGDVVAILWTSGTTGKSKGVMQSHNNWIRAAISSVDMGKYRKGDVTYSCLPLYNSAAWVSCIYPALLSGTTVAMDPVFSASDFWNRIRHFGATHTFTLGAMHIFLWNLPESGSDADNSLRSASMVPMPDAIHGEFKKRFGMEGIHQGFGQSEVMLLMRRPDDGAEYPPDALGVVADDLEVMLADDEGNKVPVGEHGEICVRPKSDHVIFAGYFDNDEANEAAFRGDWYCTGDLARQDESGNFYFVDRKKDVLRYKGRNVSSMAIEAVARNHPGVRDVAVFGIASEELASEHEIMLAAIRGEDADVTEEELARFINDNAPYFFVPRFIEFVEVLPMTPTQKVRKVELRERGLTEATWDAIKAGFKVQR